jgi:cell division protein FtsW
MQDVEVRRWQPDRALFLMVIALVVIGLAMVFSASTAVTLDRGLSPFHFFVKQIIAVVIGFALMYLSLRFDYRLLAQPKLYMPILGFAVVLLLVVLFMPPVNNTNRWIILGPVSFQPSELAKPALVIALAAVASRWRELLRSWAFSFLTLAVFVAPVVFLIAIEPDLGTAAVVAVVSLAVLFAGGIGIRNLIIVLMIVAVGLGLFVWSSPYRLSRIQSYLDPGADPLGSGFQINQSEIALGAGGIYGLGFMESKQKLFYLPASHSDFIFSVIGEEWGLIGSSLVLALYLALFARGLRVAFSARDLFGFLLAGGVTLMVTGQALMNISVATALIPTKGIPLPLISSGGTSLVMTMVALGLLLNVSQYCRKE